LAPLAYIDPGSGSLVIQVLIASIVAVPFLLRQQIGRAVRFLRRDRRRGAVDPEPVAGSDEPELPEA
jgi:hypothetical protein